MFTHLLAVDPDSRGKGYASQILQYALEYGKENIRLEVLSENTPAKALYERAGFDSRSTMDIVYEGVGKCSFGVYEYVY